MQRLVDHSDILQEILIRVAKSSDGAKDFARAISVCKAFRSFVDDRETLKVVCFDQFEIIDAFKNCNIERFQQIGGLICRCAKAGQEKAQFILGKIIIQSIGEIYDALIWKHEIEDYALLWEHEIEDYSSLIQARVASMLADLPEKQTKNFLFMHSFLLDTTFPDFIGNHVDFMKIYLSRATRYEFVGMQYSLSHYMNFFMLGKGFDSKKRKKIIKKSLSILKEARHYEDMVLTFDMVRDVCLEFSKALQECGVEKEELCGIEPELDVNAKTTVLEKFDMCIRLLSDAQAIKERVHQSYKHSSKHKFEVFRGVLSVLEAFDFGSSKDKVEEERALYSESQEARRDLLSKSHTYLL